MGRHDPTLGITIGAILSICSVIICVWIIVRHRICIEKRPTTAASRVSSPNTVALPPICSTDLHEMQSLILKQAPPMPNGNVKHSNTENQLQINTDKLLINTSVIEINDNLKCDNVTNDISDTLKINYLDVCPSILNLQTTNQSPTHQETGKTIRNGDKNNFQNGSIETPTIPQSSHSISQNAPSLKSKVNGNLARITENPQVSLLFATKKK